jgi:hypothetical protein
MTSNPVKLPVVVGENVTLRLVLVPGAKVRGRVGALTLKTVVLTWRSVMNKSLSPEFATTTVLLWLLSGATPVKAMLAGVAVSQLVR